MQPRLKSYPPPVACFQLAVAIALFCACTSLAGEARLNILAGHANFIVEGNEIMMNTPC